MAPRPRKPPTRSEKVLSAVDGDDEFSIASVDPALQAKQRALRLNPGGGPPARVQSTQNDRTIWRLFRKFFG